jgi:hypothetical protein
MGWADRVDIKEVCSVRSLAAYAAQETGVPYPAKSHLFAAEKLVKELFDQYPTMSWQTLCGVVTWSKDKGKRFPHVLALLNSYRYAFADGYLNEIDPNSEENKETLDTQMEYALSVETDPEWIRRLRTSKGPGRKIVYAAWKQGTQL